jgi:hypothetical protein
MAVQYNFPREQENLGTRLIMRKYSRPTPGSNQTVTTEAVFRLPLPTNLTDSFNIATNDEKMDLLGNLGKAGEVYAAGATKAEQYWKQLKSEGPTLDLLKKVAVETAAVAPGISDTVAGRYAQTRAGFIRNPHLTTIFEGVRLKNYSFNWKLAPRSQEEAQDIENIINYIKAYMHPRILGGGFALEYPYIARVEFDVGDTNLLPEVSDSFITRLDINSMGSGVPAFFKDGRPVTIEMTLGFTEINIQTRENFLNRNRRASTLGSATGGSSGSLG